MIRKTAVFFVGYALLRFDLEAETECKLETACEHLAQHLGATFGYFEPPQQANREG